MTQDEMNKELDGALEEAISNGDITRETTGEGIKEILSCMVNFTEKEWQLYIVYCVVCSAERKTSSSGSEMVQ